jgi:hypothetical protein
VLADVVQTITIKLQEENRRLREEKGFGPDEEIPEPKPTEPGAPRIKRRF